MAQAAHPHLNSNGNNVDIVWTQFTGTEHQLWHQRSTDDGKTFTAAQLLATATEGADRPFIIKKKKRIVMCRGTALNKVIWYGHYELYKTVDFYYLV